VAGGAIVIGVVTRTGSAVAVALSGAADAPRFRGRRQIGLIPPDLPAQPYHAAAGLPWRRMEKDAARAAITVLRQAAGPG